MRVAIVHDGLATRGGAAGAERVLEALKESYPHAPIYTTVYCPERMPECFRAYDIRTSFIQRCPLGSRWFKLYFSMMPMAIGRFDLSAYDVVISGHHSVAKGVRLPLSVLHICLCYTPARYLWDLSDFYLSHSGLGRWMRGLSPYVIGRMRTWDVEAAQRVDYFAALSENVARRIERCYGRSSTVIYPPVDTDRFNLVDRRDDVGEYYLIVGRLTAYKRVDLAIEACNGLRAPLVVIGDGEERRRLARLAGPTIRFLGRQPDQVLAQYYARCRALLFPGEEDTGIVPLEAQASGRPVIAYGAGGALETVVEGRTGMFFYEQTVEALTDAMQGLDPEAFDPWRIREHALRFDRKVFKERVRRFVQEKYEGRL